MKILHTESSSGWGGQEIRILREAEGMRKRGHEIFFAVQTKGSLIERAREKGFVVYEIPFQKKKIFTTLPSLVEIIKNEKIDIVNTHSSLDSWLGGIAGKIARKKVIRTRHLSTPIRKGLNSYLLYNLLANQVATTSSAIIPTLLSQARLPAHRIRCVPTGIEPKEIHFDSKKTQEFRDSLQLKPSDILIGCTCFVRSWKGIEDFLQAALLLKEHTSLKWVVIGGGYWEKYLPLVSKLGLEGIVTFTGHLEDPFSAMNALDIFVLLSTAHEGISQASLQAAYLGKPLITTSVGGLPEVCIHQQTGWLVPPHSPSHVAEAVLSLSLNQEMREQLGQSAQELVLKKFLFHQTLDAMEGLYQT